MEGQRETEQRKEEKQGIGNTDEKVRKRKKEHRKEQKIGGIGKTDKR